MASIMIVDRPLCCSTGLCGSDPDPVLVRLAEDIAWLEARGVEVERINPSQDPERFLAEPAVLPEFEAHGNACLPLVLRDGEVVSRDHYPGRDELARLAGVAEADDERVTPVVEELIALGASVASGCEPCFRHHYAEARKLGASRADMAKAATIAQTVKDAPARAMQEMVDRYLAERPAAAAARTAAVGSVADGFVPAGACCGGSAEPDAAEALDGRAAPPTGCCC